MKHGADVEPQFHACEFGDVVGKRPSGRLQIAPGMLRQVDHAVGLIDNDARRRQTFQSFAMNSRLNGRAKLDRGPRRQGLRPKGRGAYPTRHLHLGRNGRALIDSRFAVDSAERSGRRVCGFGGAEEEVT
jgi:hypothetical protein